VETHQDLARQYQVKSIPALFFMKDSQIVDKARGVQPKRELEMKLTQLLA
jgi:thioredoxin-like negative regulator of GroEL